MPLDPRAQRFLAMIGASGDRSAAATADAQRATFRNLMIQAGAPALPVATADITVPGADAVLPARIYGTDTGSGGASRGGLVFFHGGGLVAGDLDTHDGICSRLAQAAGVRVIAVAYRLAPENPFPAAVEDAIAAATYAVDHALEFGLDPARIAIGGDSVGANLAATACRHLVGSGRRVRAQLLICPVLDGRRRGASHRLFATGYFLDEGTLDRELKAYAGDAALDLDDPRVSPVAAQDLSGLPRTIVETAEYDPVRDDGAAYAARLRASGVPVTETCHAGMIHLFYGFGRLIPAGAEALAAIGGRLAAALDP